MAYLGYDVDGLIDPAIAIASCLTEPTPTIVGRRSNLAQC